MSPTSREQPNGIERIADGDDVLAIIIRAAVSPPETSFITPETYNQQVGFIVYPAGGEVVRHSHKPVERTIIGTSEVLIVRKGRCELDVYNDAHELVAMRELHVGDVAVIISGGHGFRMIEDTILLEIKQGPYIGDSEKRIF